MGGDLPATDLHFAGTAQRVRRAEPKMVLARAVNVGLETISFGRSGHAGRVSRAVYRLVYRAICPSEPTRYTASGSVYPL